MWDHSYDMKNKSLNIYGIQKHAYESVLNMTSVSNHSVVITCMFVKTITSSSFSSWAIIKSSIWCCNTSNPGLLWWYSMIHSVVSEVPIQKLLLVNWWQIWTENKGASQSIRSTDWKKDISKCSNMLWMSNVWSFKSNEKKCT